MGSWKERKRPDEPFAAARRILADQQRRKEQVQRAVEERRVRREREKAEAHAEQMRIIREREEKAKAEELRRHLAEAAPAGYIDVQEAEEEAVGDCGEWLMAKQRREHRAKQQAHKVPRGTQVITDDIINCEVE